MYIDSKVLDRENGSLQLRLRMEVDFLLLNGIPLGILIGVPAMTFSTSMPHLEQFIKCTKAVSEINQYLDKWGGEK